MTYQNYSATTDFDQTINTISNGIQKIKQNSNQLSQLSKQLGTAKDNELFRNNLNDILHGTSGVVAKTNDAMKKLINYRTSASELALNKFKRVFEQELQNFARVQKEVVDKIKSVPQFSDQRARNTNPFGDEESNAFGGDFDNERTSLLKQKQMQDLDDRHDMMRDRESRIVQIERDVVDINMIMRDLATLVNEQGTLVDHISSNIETTSDNVESGNQQLGQAMRYASKYRKKVCFLIIFLIVIILAIGLTIYFSIVKK